MVSMFESQKAGEIFRKYARSLPLEVSNEGMRKDTRTGYPRGERDHRGVAAPNLQGLDEGRPSVERTHWNEHMIFERQAGLLKWASDSLKPGDLVLARSTPFQTEWKKDGETHYGQTFAVNELTLLTAKADKKEKQEETVKPRSGRSR